MLHVRLLAALAVVPLALAGCDGAASRLLAPDSALLSVGPTARVEVNCPSQMEVGASAQCNAYGYDSDGNFTSETVSAWSSSNSTVVSVTSTGIITAHSAGTATIYATIDGVTGSTSVHVPGPIVVSISGSDPVQPGANCTWWADTSGGSGTYSYSWQVTGATGTAYDHEWMGTVDSGASSVYLEVVVTDSNGAQGSAQKTVTVSSDAMICLQ